MAFIDRREGAADAVSVANLNQGFVERTIDFADGVDTYSSASVVGVFYVPANTYIERITAQCLTAEGATATVDIGLYDDDGDSAVDADGFLSGFNLNSATVPSCSAPGTLTEGGPNVYTQPYCHGVYCTAARTLALLLNHTLDAAKIKVRARMLPM